MGNNLNMRKPWKVAFGECSGTANVTVENETIEHVSTCTVIVMCRLAAVDMASRYVAPARRVSMRSQHSARGLHTTRFLPQGRKCLARYLYS